MMADVNATFNYDADFTSAITQVRALSRELGILNSSFNSLDKDARKVRDRFAEVFKADVGDLGAFSARTVDITSNMDNFGKALDRNKLKLREYAREARKSFQADSNARKLAEDQVRRTRAELVDLGMDANGRRKGILVTPLRLDMSDMQTQMDVARKQFSIFNKLVNDGATQLINWGKNTQWAGRQLTVGLTVPMTIFATTTIKAFNDVDRELTRFQKVYGSDLVGATTQATNAIRQQVQALAVDIAGAYGVAVKETAGLAADLAATGLEGQKLLDSVKQTTRLSVLGEIDRQDAMKTTLSLQNAFNMSTKELADSINFLNAVENQTSLSLQDLTEAIPKVGPVVRALGGDVKDLSVLMVAMKEGGINAAEGANALKSGLASLINPTKAGSEVAKQYGIDLEGIVKRNKGQLLPTVLEFQQSMSTLDDLGKAKIIEQLFGKYQFARISALFDNLNTAGSQTKQVIDLMSASNSDLARIANAEIKTLTESASMRFQRSMEAIKASLLPVGEAIVNSVLPFMERLSGALDTVVRFAKDLPGPVKSFLKLVTGFTVIAGPLIMMTGVLGNFLGYITKGAMAFVNLGRLLRGLPVEKFQLLDDIQIAAAKATDTVTISIERQKAAMVGLNKVMMDYYALLNKQAAKTPNLFTAPVQAVVPGGQSKKVPIKRQKGGSAWVPGSGSGDKIPALLEPGEFVVNRNASKQYGGVLEDMNNGVPRFANGGIIPGYQTRGYVQGVGGRRLQEQLAALEGRTTRESRNVNTSRVTRTPQQGTMTLEELGSLLDIDVSQSSSVRNLYDMLDQVPKSKIIRSRNKSSTKNPVGRLRDTSRSLFQMGWSTKDQELEILRRHGIGELGYASAHIEKRTIVMPDGTTAKVWSGDNLLPDLQAVNNAFQFNGVDRHPTTADQARSAINALRSSLSNPDATPAARSYGQAAIEILEARLNGDYYTDFAPRAIEQLSEITQLGLTSQVFKTNPANSRKNGGLIYAQSGMNTSAWVPGSGEGDRVPAMLEPGEFVVNKKAAMKYGGMLEEMNWNLAPRFARGSGRKNKGKSSFDRQRVQTQSESYEIEDDMSFEGEVSQSSQSMRIPGMKTGAISGGLMAASMAASFLPMNKFTENLNKAVMAISAFTGVLSAVQTMMPAKAGAAAGGKAAGGMAGMLKNPMASIARLGPMLLNPWVLATAAVGATVFAVYKYRDSIKQAGKDGKAIFDSQTEAAKELGIELKTTAQNMEAISGNFNPLQPTVKAPSVLTVEQQDAIAETDQNKRLIEQLKSTQDAQAILMTQYSRMILDGMMPEEAMAIVKVIAERSGKAQDFFKAAPEMGAIGKEENPQKQFQLATASFTRSIANLTPKAGPENETNWQQLFSGSNVTPQEKESIKMGVSGALEAVQMAPDLSSFIKGMDTLTKSVTDLEKAGKGLGLEAITEFAKTKYGEESSFFKAFNTLPDDLNTVENKLMLITASSAGVNLDEFLMDGKLAQEEINIINQQLKQTGINAEIDLRIKNAATAQLEKIQKQSIAVQSSYDASIAKNEQLVDAENERYKKAGKAHQAFIKAKQKEIDSIDKQADKEIDAITKTSEEFLKALNEGDRQSQFSSEQRQTAIGGLGALASGDIFGFMQSQEQMQSNATSFAYDNEINAVEEKRDKEIEAIEEVRKKRIEALQEEIDKRQEAAEREDEKHERRLAQLEAQRVAAQRNYSQAITELQRQEEALKNISTYTGPDFAKMVAGYEGTASMAAKVAAAEAAITALSQGKTVDEAIKAGQDYLGKHALTSSAYNNKILKDSGYSGAGMILKAEGGYIEGPGTATSDSIPARLSNGEYVVKASSVSKYGVGMMNLINDQKFAKGGLVGNSDPVDDYSRISYGGKTFNARTVRMLKKAEEIYGSNFGFYQGSYSTKIKASRGTHDGGGAVDIKPPTNIDKALKALSQAGFWAKWRGQMNPPHIHALAKGDAQLSSAARRQLGLPADGGYEGDPVEGPNDSMGNIAAALSALGTNIATVNTVRSKGVRGLMNPRQFGGSMTMNKPYLVGERGPEVFLPYGAGGKISPISYDVPQNTTGMATQTAAIAGGITTQESSNVYYNVNVDASATNNPRDVANYVIRALKQEENRRSFSRRIS